MSVSCCSSLHGVNLDYKRNPICLWDSLEYSISLFSMIDCMIFVSPFLNVTRMPVSTVSFLTQLDSGILSIESFPLTYDLDGFKSRISRHILTAGSF